MWDLKEKPKPKKSAKGKPSATNETGIKGSFYERAKELCGCLESESGDLSTNKKKYLQGFGESRHDENNS